ncbi:MAG: response regulator, partial [Candidatus Binatia bacterium]
MKVLLLEGGKGPSRQTQDELNAKGITVTPVQDLATCLATLEADRDWTVIIDLDLYRGGIEALQEIRRISPEIVVIAMASLKRLTVVDEALKYGALDFVIKQPDLSHLQEIPQAITRGMEWKRLQSEMQSSQQESQWLMAALAESSDGIFVTAPEGKIIFANPALCSCLGFNGNDLIGEPIETVLPSLEADESSWTEVPQPFPHRKWQGRIAIKKKD